MTSLLSENPNSYLIISVLIFSAGMFTVLTRKNILAIIMGIELMLNASALNFITFSFFRKSTLYSGHVFAILIIVLAAAEAVVALAILLAIFQQRKSVMTDDISDMKG
ncbi:MAG: NADH-quinone oxidoreductase subunit NuoK [Spirochaetia bacterium]|nr:NADH-quinone oxidoreductase subunit NuoK [Spirochaetia bacterium]